MEINFAGRLKEGSFSEPMDGFTALRKKFNLHRERKLITVSKQEFENQPTSSVQNKPTQTKKALTEIS